MSKPRPIEKGATYLLTRRCFQRQLLLVPSALTNQIVTYCLGIAAERYDILVHAFCFMSTHYHIVATDPRGELPEFMRWMNEFIAKSMNARYGRWESFWAPQSYSAVKLLERNDILAKIVYTLQNPVSAGLVATHEQWPGACSRPEDMLGTVRTVERPKVFFRKDGALPATATLRLSAPPMLASPDATARFVCDVAGMLAQAETIAKAKVVAEGRRFLGRKAVLVQRHTDFPRTHESRRKLNPRIACRDTWRRIEALGRLRAFYDAYREAWLRFRDGVHDVVFPEGTYWMTRYAGARYADG